MKDSSTPKVVHVKARRALHDYLQVRDPSLSTNNCSDIPKGSNMNSSREFWTPESSPYLPARHDSVLPNDENNMKNSSDEVDQSSSENETSLKDFVPHNPRAAIASSMKSPAKTRSSSSPIRSDSPGSNNIYYFVMGTLVLIISAVWYLNGPTSTSTNAKYLMEQIKQTYHTQSDDLWIALESGVKDLNEFNRPVSFILLYRKDSRKTVDNLLQDVSQYVLCNISSCTNRPIILGEKELNSPKSLDDFGSLIEKYKEALEDCGLMIIEHLEKMPGKTASVFHSFCDEISPLVEKSMFIFTMEVDRFRGDQNVRFLEQYLREQWKDVKNDHFQPLFTRISGMVLEIMP